MSALSRFHTWWRGLTHRGRLENEIETEMRFHIESYAEELTLRGVERKEAMRRARAELGSVAAQKDEIRASLGLRPWDDLRADARYAVRQLRQAPGFTLTVVFVLTLGIGASTAMFSVLDVTLLRWLPYTHSNQLVSVRIKDAKNSLAWNFYADIEEWQARTRSLTALAYYEDGGMYLGDGEQVSAPSVSANLFAALGVRPAMGRGFLPEEQQPGGRKVVVLSDSLWSNLYHRDPQILGQQIRLNDNPHTVVGVMPPGFAFPIDAYAQVWVPAEITANHHKRDFSTHGFDVIGRMQDRATPTAVQAELTAIEQPLAPLYKKLLGEQPDSLRVEVSRYRETLVRDLRPALLALIAAVTFMWLIACANVANLMLARGVARQREIAVRGALGASQGRLIRQLLTESLLLSLLGAGCGLGLAQASLRLFEKALSVQLKVPTHMTPNPQVLGALLVLSVLSAVVFGLLPAWLAARTPIEQSLRAGSPQAGGHRKRHRLQQILVVAELGLSLTLLIGCGLMLRTLFALRRVPLGFRVDHVLLIRPAVPQYKYRHVDVNRAIYQPLQARLQGVSGVTAIAMATNLPLSNDFQSGVTLYHSEGKSPSDAKPNPIPIHAQLKAVSPQFKDVLGFPMYKGRFFNEHDTQDSQPAIVVNRAFANLYAPDGEVIDKLQLNLGPNRAAKVVGIMDDFHQAAINQPAAPEIDFCAPQLKPTDVFYQPTVQVYMELAVRTTRDPAKVIPDIRRAMSEVSTDLQASSFETMDQVVEDSMGSQLLAARLLEIFGGAAMLIALAGLYGLLMYLVSQRTQELGVRMALGAQREMIISLILKQAGRMLLAGTATGLIVAFFSSRLLASFLYGVKHHDLWTAVSVSGVLLACGLTAAYLPARRASRVDPVETLRAS
jgi:predicted permease